MAPQAFEIMEFMPENGAVWRAEQGSRSLSFGEGSRVSGKGAVFST